ncbi:MAG: deoxyribose-phosphate aldolase [Paludibacteraceae bacterium]
MATKFEELFNLYECDSISDEQVKTEVEKILTAHFEENNNVDVYKQCFNCIDLTSLKETDTEEGITNMVQKVNDFDENFPDIPGVAAICIYPSLVSVVKATLTEPIGIAAVSAGFPASQTFIEVKVAETAMCVMEGATEIDVVISVGKFLEGKYEEVYDELSEIKSSCRNAHLKVILETGALKTASNIKKASVLAMAAGANFIKTSTGKIPVAATPEATYVMCSAIKEWNEKAGGKIGYKPAGGIASTEDAVKHFTLVKEILGADWLNNKQFRFGTSSLANKLLTSIRGEEVKYF